MFTETASNIDIKPTAAYRGLPAASDRAAWTALPGDLKDALAAAGENYLGYSWSQILATDYMEFTRTGNRVHYEDRQFSRRTALDALVLAECAEYQGRFLDDIVNGIFLICEESGWQLPAHNSADGPQLPLPDITNPVIDLFAAETAAVLGVAEYLLRDALAEVSPAISSLINDNLQRRIFTPYLTKYFWWMGNGTRQMNNWTPWCTQNILLAAFTRDADFGRTGTQLPGGLPDWKNRVFRQACRSLDYFLADYEEDGCCDEGAQYFGHAALTLFESLEILNDITGGAFAAAYRTPKIRNMAAYIQNVHIAGPYYLNFADCSPLAGRRGAREYLFGKRTENPTLAAFAARDYAEGEMREKLGEDEHNLFYRAQSVFFHEEMTEAAAACRASEAGPHPAACRTSEAGPHPAARSEEADDMPPDIFYPSTGLFIARDRQFCLAVKAGDNDDSHNHNDTGSFIIYKNGRPLFIDLGVESYTQKTFSDRRYEIWTMQSAWHNLPSIGGVTQAAGPEYRAVGVECSLRKNSSSPAESGISMDIAPAYPDSRIRSYIRTAALKRDSRIVIRDSWQLAEPMSVVLSLLTSEKPVCSSCMEIQEERHRRSSCMEIQIGALAACSIQGAEQITIEEVPITDPRLAKAWPERIYRILITAGGSSLELRIV